MKAIDVDVPFIRPRNSWLVFYCNYVSILYRFQDIITYLTRAQQ